MVIKMWSESNQKDMWWVESGDNYIGPFLNRHQAEALDPDNKNPDK